MTSKKKLDLGEWYQRLYVASEGLRLAVEEVSALGSQRGLDLEADWCRELISAAIYGHQSFQHLEAVFELLGEQEAERCEPGSEPPVALYLKSH
jgi:hypothetical protein